ncbi:MAG: hypothetical protein QXU24_02595, partial [Ignisphaera sp.]
ISILLLMLMPHTYLELFSYSLSIIVSLKLTLSFIKRRVDKVILYNSIATIIVSYIILLLSAVIETVLISL